MRRPLVLLLAASPACTDVNLQGTNSEPSARIVSHEDDQAVAQGEVLAMVGRVEDADHDSWEVLATAWFLDGTEVCAERAAEPDGTTRCDVPIGGGGTARVVLEVRDPEARSAQASVALKVTPNAPPEVQLDDPGDGPFYANAGVLVRGTVSDDADAPTDLVLTWRSDLSGELPVDAAVDGAGRVSAAVVLPRGRHQLTLVAGDTLEAVGSDSILVDVGPENRAPDCAISEPADGASGGLAETVTFRAVVSDPDVAADTLAVTWTSDRDGLLGAAAPASDGAITLPVTGLSPGPHLVTLTVTDDAGASCVDDVVYNAGDGPLITQLLPANGAVVAEGATTVLSAHVADDADPPEVLDLIWSSDLDGVLSTAPAGSDGRTVVTTSALSRGTHAVTLSATDASGLETTALTVVRVDGLPSAPGVVIQPGAPRTADDLVAQIAAPATDPDAGDALTTRFLWYTDDPASPASTSASLPAALTSRGQVWTVRAVANDGFFDGPFTERSIAIGDTPPVVTGVNVTPDPAVTSDTLTCDWTPGTDVDGDGVTHEVAWRVDGALVPPTSTTLTSSWFGRGQRVACEVTPVAGGATGAAVASNEVLVGNAAPTVSDVRLDPALFFVDDAVWCRWVFTDADGDADASTVLWTVDGLPAGTGNPFPGDLLPGQTLACEVTPRDDVSAGPVGTASGEVGDRRPVIDALPTITPSPAREGDTLTCTPGAASDPDGLPVTLRYRWAVEGVFLGQGPPQLGSGSFGRGDRVTCTVIASDGRLDSLPAMSAELVISNTAPTLGSARISPTPARVRDTLTCEGLGADDVDGDTIFVDYAWSVDGVGVATGPTLSGVFSVGSEVTCLATPSDDTAVGQARAATLVIENTPPDAPQVGLRPDAPREGRDDLRCIVLAPSSDADGDDVTYRFDWTVDGLPYTGAVDSGVESTVDVSVPVEGELWTCTVTPSDGVVDGPAASSSETIGPFCTWGTEADCAGRDCLDLLGLGVVDDGPYWIDPDGTGPFEAWCDQSTDGGGWTLVMTLDDATAALGFDAPQWETPALLNEAAVFPNSTQYGLDTKQMAYNHVRGSTLRAEFVEPGHDLHYDLLDGRTALELFSGPEELLAGQLGTGCGELLSATPDYDASLMSFGRGVQFFGINGYFIDGAGLEAGLRFGYASNDEDGAIYIPEFAVGTVRANGSQAGAVWLPHDDCSWGCGCYGTVTPQTDTSANLWVR